LVPGADQPPPGRPEIAYILKDSGAKVFVAHERFADASIAAADEVGLPATARIAVGAVKGFSSYHETGTRSRPRCPRIGRWAT
jgi:long-chain acyl-CoA synthetase